MADRGDTPPPQGPYRASELAVTIAPDRRAQVAVVLLGVGFGMGVLFHVGLVARREAKALEAAALVSSAAPAGVVAATLSGPGGTVAIPGKTGAVVHVWLQGCADCMPAFEAHKRLAEAGELAFALPVVNVSYGEASPVWANGYHLDTSLVTDRGPALVQPLGISSFTTLVVNRRGKVVLRDRADSPGYAERVRTAARVVALEE